jgi:hypothetical protein
MPDMTPVGAMVKPPDPMQGINTMSGILGLQQQRQDLQTGQYTQQKAALEAGQQQGVQNFFSTWDPSEHIAQDGTTDLDSALTSKEFKAAGNAKPAIMQALLDAKSKQLTNKTQLAGLNSALVTQLGSQAGALAKDPDVVADESDPTTGVNPGRAKVTQMFANFAKQSPDAARIAQIYGPMAEHTPPQKLSNAVTALQMQAQDVGGQQAQQNPQQFAVNTGPATNVYNVNKATGLQPGQQPAQAIRQGLAPTDQPNYKRQAAAAGTEGAAGAGNDEALYNNILQSGAKATQIKSLAQDVQGLAGEVQTGQYSKAFADKWAALAQTFGLPAGATDAATKRQLLAKAAARLKMQSEAGASTDAERAGVDAAMPDPDHMTPQAVQEAARYVGAQSDAAAARMEFANKHRQINGGTSTGLRATDSQFMQAADPKVFEYQSIPAGAPRQNFLKQNFKSKDELKAFLDKQQTLKSYGAIQ